MLRFCLHQDKMKYDEQSISIMTSAVKRSIGSTTGFQNHPTRAFSVIVKTGRGTDGALHSTSHDAD